MSLRFVGFIATMVAVVVLLSTPPLVLGSSAQREPSAKSQTPGGSNLFRITYDPVDSLTVLSLRPMIRLGIKRVSDFWGSSYRRSFEIVLCPDRKSFNQSFPPEWGMAQTECWMVATGASAKLHILSPRVWKTEACEHDPTDSQHVQNIITHELVHVYHAQCNPSNDFDTTVGIDWFVEGLATYVSGQLEDGHMAPASEAIRLGLAPDSLSHAWSGKYRYGVCGSLVRFVDRTYGRGKVVKMLKATKGPELLRTIGVSEADLIAAWKQSLSEH